MLFAVLAALITVTYRMGSLPLLSPDEGRNAEVAREMKNSGAWLVPSYNQLPYLDKPAFYFKTVALSLSLLGDNEYGARMSSALFAAAVLFLAWRFTRHQCGSRPAALAVLVIATSPLFISQARIVIFDIALCLFVCLAVVSGYRAEQLADPQRTRWLRLGAAAAGFATLVKGPVGFLLPIVVLSTYHATRRDWAGIRRLFRPLHILIFLAIVLPWFVGVSLQHPDFPDYGLVQESFKRFTTSQFHRGGPVYYYALVMPATFFPWSLLIPGGVWFLTRNRSALPEITRLCLCWCLAVVVFFSMSKSKLPGYILSISVPFGILVAQLLDAALSRPDGTAGRILRKTTTGLVTLMVVLTLGLIVAAPQTGLLPHPLPLKKVNLADYSSAVIPVATLFAIIAAIGSGGLMRRKSGLNLSSFALLPILLVVLGAGVFDVVFQKSSARPIAERLSHLPKETGLVFYQCFPTGLPFYLRRTGTLITETGGELTSNYAIYMLKRTESWPSPVVKPQDFDLWLGKQTGDLYLFFKSDRKETAQALATRYQASLEELPNRFLGLPLPAKARQR